MSKAVLVSVVVALTSILYAQNTISSANTVGYIQRNLIPGQPLLIGVGFTADKGGSPTLTRLLGTKQLRAGNSLSDADRVLIWNTKTGNYEGYILHSDRKFYPLPSQPMAKSVDPVVPIGTSFWIMPSANATTTNTLYISGNVSDGPALPNDPQAGKQMLCNPFGGEMALSALTQSLNPQQGDQVALLEGRTYRQYILRKDGKWHLNGGKPDGAGKEEPRAIAPGEGFWFIRK